MNQMTSSLLRWVPIPAGCIAVVLAVGGIRLIEPPQVQISEMMLGDLPAIGSLTRDLVIHNRDWVRSVEIVHCESSCGCAAPTISHLVVRPLSSARIPIKIEPRPWEQRLASRIGLELADGRSFVVSVQAGLVQLFKSGPDRAMAQRNGEQYEIPFDPVYDRSIAGGFVVVPGQAAPVPVAVDSEHHRLRIQSSTAIPLDSTAQLVLKLEPLELSLEWSGWLIPWTEDGVATRTANNKEAR